MPAALPAALVPHAHHGAIIVINKADLAGDLPVPDADDEDAVPPRWILLRFLYPAAKASDLAVNKYTNKRKPNGGVKCTSPALLWSGVRFTSAPEAVV